VHRALDFAPANQSFPSLPLRPLARGTLASPSLPLPRPPALHRFYECTVAGQWKETYRKIIRDNRDKHARWRLGPSCSQNRCAARAHHPAFSPALPPGQTPGLSSRPGSARSLVLAAVKNWFCPTSHDINKQWAGRNRAGWTNADRVQCEACRKWRRLPEGLDGWPREFYCALNTCASAPSDAPQPPFSLPPTPRSLRRPSLPPILARTAPPLPRARAEQVGPAPRVVRQAGGGVAARPAHHGRPDRVPGGTL
jgi:hypothetical protein